VSQAQEFNVDNNSSIANNQQSIESPEWRNWQTRGTQNPVRFTPGVGSIPTSGNFLVMRRACFVNRIVSSTVIPAQALP
jgi:hypothetical protein